MCIRDRCKGAQASPFGLIGNSLFKPGMTVFIDPLVSGFGSVANPSSVANQLAIGGYYIILGVTHYIKGQTFETSLRCIWNAMPNKEKKSLPATLMKLDIDFGTPGKPPGDVFGLGDGRETEAQRIARERREYWEGRNATNTGLSESATITAYLISTGRFSRSKDGKVRKRFAKILRVRVCACVRTSVAISCSAPSTIPCLLPLLLAPRAFLLGAQVAVAGIACVVWCALFRAWARAHVGVCSSTVVVRSRWQAFARFAPPAIRAEACLSGHRWSCAY